MNQLLEKIEQIVGSKGLLLGDEVTARALDWMGKNNRQAKAIVRPKNTAEVSEVLKACYAAKQSVVTVGGLTGLVQGTDSNTDDIVLSMERQTQILESDVIGKTLTVQTGAPLQKVQEYAEKMGLKFALDLGARGSCTIGGNIATNAGGNQVLRYGMMREQVLGLEVVLADGTILSSMNSLLKNNTGYDLKQLFIGSEGTLGIITKAVLRLHPQTTSTNTALVALESFEDLTRFFALMGEQLAGGLTSFEVMWNNHYSLLTQVSKRHLAPIPTDYAYYVVVEQQGVHQQRDSQQFSGALEIAMEKEWLVDAVIAQSKQQAQSIWAIREDIEGLVIAMTPFYAFDISLPIKHMQEFINTLQTQLTKIWHDKARLVVFGHLGDGNLHVGISIGEVTYNHDLEIKQLVYLPLQKIGGSISAEHGIGLEKKDYLSISRSKDEINTMKKIKQMLDPLSILNPNKIF